MSTPARRRVFSDGSCLMIEALVQSGATAYMGYPITPANWLYAHASRRFPTFLPAPDEISAIQWAAGYAATGHVPVTATSFPGFALMLESLNMVAMMELPLVLILVQRLGPSTGSATTGAQGDLLLLRGAISGGYPLPVLCPSTVPSCWTLASTAVETALALRTPVVLLTSKEMIMTSRTIDLEMLPKLHPHGHPPVPDDAPPLSYRAGRNGVPPFLPVGTDRHQVRLNASTHDDAGLIRKATGEALANTRRLKDKIDTHIASFTRMDVESDGDDDLLVVSYGISAEATREAVRRLRADGVTVTLAIPETLLPVPPELLALCRVHRRIVFVEENLDGQLRQICMGGAPLPHVTGIHRIGAMIPPGMIAEEIQQWLLQPEF